MRLRILSGLILVACLGLMTTGCASTTAPESAASDIPHMQQQGTATQLIVDGEPYLALAGELMNSASSSADYMEPIWPALAEINLNTVLGVVSWEQMEPVEGEFDFRTLDAMIQGARENDMRLVVLWFGSWKNGTSRYAPVWVKEDQERFPRVRNAEGQALEILSTFNEATRESDATAFAALMRHIREVDGAQHTVIMIQVENEMGVLGDTRDRSEAANSAFVEPVPQELMDYLQAHKDTLLPEFRQIWEAGGFKTSGTWQEVFGSGTAADETFMVWNYARYVDKIAETGKAEHALPMFVNAWIVQPEDKAPGDYPSGGPVDHMHDVWRAGAPHIDMLCPDIYLPNFTELVARYSRSGNPTFIPESFSGARGAANAFYAIGQHNAIGYSPFGIDRYTAGGPIPPGQTSATAPEDNPFASAYDVLDQLAPLILEHQGKGTMAAVSLESQNPDQDVELGDYILHVGIARARRGNQTPQGSGYGLFIATGPDEYVMAGSRLQVTFSPNTPGPKIAGLGLVQEGTYENGSWAPGRLLNGDDVQFRYDLSGAAAESQSGAGVRLGARSSGLTIVNVKLYRYE